jgi:hypothetical protein
MGGRSFLWRHKPRDHFIRKLQTTWIKEETTNFTENFEQLRLFLDLHTFLISPVTNIKVIKLRNVIYVGHVACMREDKIHTKF